MNYFLSDKDLKKALDKEREFLFSAIARALHELEHKFLILFDIGIIKSDPKIKKKEKNMEDEPRAIRPFYEVLDELFDYILQSEDHRLIILADELQKSAEEGEEKKEIWVKALRKSYRKAKELIKEEDEKGKS